VGASKRSRRDTWRARKQSASVWDWERRHELIRGSQVELQSAVCSLWEQSCVQSGVLCTVLLQFAGPEREKNVSRTA